MRKVTFIIIFLHSVTLSFSQYIEGKVVDATTNEPIEGVNVFMKGIHRGAITNSKGNYYLKFPYKIVKSDVIQFSHLTYKNLEIPYTQKTKNYSVQLMVDSKKLKEVKIYQKKNLKKSITFKKLSSMKHSVHSFGSMLVDNKIFVIGGDVSVYEDMFKKTLEYYPDVLDFGDFLNRASRYASFSTHKFSNYLQQYDIASNTWKKSILKFKKRAYHQVNFYNNQLYILGGKNIARNLKDEYLDADIEIFDLKKDTVIIDKTNPHKAVNFASFTYNDVMILMGGSLKVKNNGLKKYSNKVHLYNFKTGVWYELGNMPIAKETQGVLIKDKIYLVGGFKDAPLSSIESFDLKTQKWKKEGNLFYGVSKPALAHNNNCIYIFNNGKIRIYNTLTKELKTYLIDLNLQLAQLYYANNTLYVLGGFKNTNFSMLPSRGLYSICLDEFDKTKVHNLKNL
jgi:hypothetical protein